MKSSKDNAESENQRLRDENKTLRQAVEQWKSISDELDAKEEDLTKRVNLFRQLFKERTQNFPLVGRIWSELIEVTESERERALRYKKRPALKAADEVRAIKIEKRQLVKELTSWKYKAENYESVYPWLAEEIAQDSEMEAEADIYFSVYRQEERADPVSDYISPDEYRKLTETDRNQLALDHYWRSGRKTKWMIGKMYERYVGYLYESNGWKVEYFGIRKRFEDLGRDLIAVKGKEVHVIQCKNWSRFKNIYENHIFQLFGTAYSMRDDYPERVVTPVFYTSTTLSEVAKEFARLLDIEIHENEKFQEYPAIKCNISPRGDKIYHLPFDQQYDTATIIPSTGEFYADTVKEAEASGFRRAFRWSGNK